MILIVGLGNIGKKYEGSRHNAGFLAARWLARQWGVERHWSEKSKLESYVLRHQERDVLLAQPTTMMNESGRAVRKLMDYYELTPTDIVLIHDDADLNLADIRVADSTQTGAGHHGVLSVIEHIGPGFQRIRIGIGRPGQPVRDISDYVLGRLSTEDKRQLEVAFDKQLLDLIA